MRLIITVVAACTVLLLKRFHVLESHKSCSIRTKSDLQSDFYFDFDDVRTVYVETMLHLLHASWLSKITVAFKKHLYQIGHTRFDSS